MEELFASPAALLPFLISYSLCFVLLFFYDLQQKERRCYKKGYRLFLMAIPKMEEKNESKCAKRAHLTFFVF